MVKKVVKGSSLNINGYGKNLRKNKSRRKFGRLIQNTIDNIKIKWLKLKLIIYIC